MFESIEGAAPDPIFGLTKLFRDDPNPDKINLAVGVYQDESGHTPALDCVQEAVVRLANRPADRQYLPIDGINAYNRRVGEILLGVDHPALASQRVVTVQTLGGTSALRVISDTLASIFGSVTVWASNPTWGNHKHIFSTSGHRFETYSWIDESRTGLDFSRLMEDLNEIPRGDVLLLHGCCHNPTGVDPTAAQWSEIQKVVLERELLPIFDVAYQGFAESLEKDVQVLREFCNAGTDVIICNSFSKNFSLYNERVGGLTVCAANSDSANKVLSQIKRCVRGNYSNPPHQGAALVAEVLADATLRDQWVRELEAMRSRIISMRTRFREGMSALLPDADFEFVTKQRGMFSFTGLDKDQAERLRNEFAIYLLNSGRINLAGLSNSNVERVCECIAAVSKAKV